MDDAELDMFIVENLADLDATAKRIYGVERRVWGDLADALSSAAKKSGWIGDFDHDDDIVMLPKDWISRGERQAWFDVSWGPDDTGDGVGNEPWFELSRYCGVGGGRLCIWLNWKGVSAKAWKPLVRSAATELQAMGFELDRRATPYTDCTLDLATVARGLEDNNLDEALNAARDGFERTVKASVLLGKLLQKARSA